MPTNTNTLRGGQRPNSGRPMRFGDACTVSFKIDAAMLEKIPGNRSEFIRQAIIEKINRNAKANKKV